MRNLIFWKGMEDVSFKQTDEGDVFFPYGIYGAGYIVDPALKAQITAAVRSYYSLGTIFVIIGAFSGSFGGWRTLVVLLPALMGFAIFHHFRFRKILRGAPKSRHRMGLGEVQRAAAQRISNGRLVAVLTINALFVVACFFLFLLVLTKYDQTILLISLGGFLFFGLCLALTGRLAWLKWAETENSNVTPP